MHILSLILLAAFLRLSGFDFLHGADEISRNSQLRGKEVFLHNCAACHGATGKGDGPAAKAVKPAPRNFTSEPFKYGNTPQRIFKTISEGIEGTPMPSWKDLPEADRWALAHYVKSLSTRAAGQKRAPRKK